jgi:hypothetical protein
MCDVLNSDNRAACYAAMGVDAERVDKLLDKAVALERCFEGLGPPARALLLLQ